MFFKNLATMVGLVTVMAGCATQPDNSTSAAPATEAPPSQLDAGVWTLASINEQRPQVSELSLPRVEFMSQEQRVSGYSGCNQFNGGYTQEDTEISFGPMMSSRRACQETAELEMTVLKLFSDKVSWKIEAGILTITNSQHKVTATFSQ